MTAVSEQTGAAARSPRSIGRGALAVISRSPRGGGVAYIARLLERALVAGTEDPLPILSLDQEHADSVSRSRKVRFAARLLAHSVVRRSDWILFNHPGIASAQRLIPHSVRLPHVVQLHGTDAWERPPSQAVREAALRIAPSRYTIERAQRTYPEIGSIALCPHGLLPSSPVQGAPDEALLSRIGGASVLILGRLLASEGRKGHDQLLECWTHVEANVPDAQLVIAGDGDDVERLRRKALAMGIAQHVVFTGYVSDATREALLRHVALFAMPSQQEGFGLVYLEAMRAGLPCIGALDDGATEPIVEGETGLLVPQSDLEALSRAIVTLLLDANLRRRLGAAGRERFIRLYTFEAYRARLLDLLSAHLG